MPAFLGRRLAQSLVVVLGAVTIIFVLVRVVPGDPAALMLGITATPEQIAALHESLGLDDPILVQYGRYLLNVLTLDFGESFRLAGPAMEHVLSRLPGTALDSAVIGHISDAPTYGDPVVGAVVAAAWLVGGLGLAYFMLARRDA